LCALLAATAAHASVDDDALLKPETGLELGVSRFAVAHVARGPVFVAPTSKRRACERLDCIPEEDWNRDDSPFEGRAIMTTVWGKPAHLELDFSAGLTMISMVVPLRCSNAARRLRPRVEPDKRGQLGGDLTNYFLVGKRYNLMLAPDWQGGCRITHYRP
jgi:hypothetical protein